MGIDNVLKTKPPEWLWLRKQCRYFHGKIFILNYWFISTIVFGNCLIIVGSECKTFAIESISPSAAEIWNPFSEKFLCVSFLLLFKHGYADKRAVYKHLWRHSIFSSSWKRVYLHNWKKIKSSNDICIRSVLAHPHHRVCERM